MQLHHNAPLAHPADEVFAFARDLRRLAACVPGASIDGGTANECRGRVRIKAGPVVVAYAGEASVVDRDDDQRRLTFAAAARGDGAAGRLDVTFDVTVEPRGDGSVVTVVTDLRLKGIAAQLGRGPTEAVADQLIKGLVDNLESRLRSNSTEAGPAAEPSGSGAGVAAPAATASDTTDREPQPLETATLVGNMARGLLGQHGVGLGVGVLVGILVGRWSGARRNVVVCCPCSAGGRAHL